MAIPHPSLTQCVWGAMGGGLGRQDDKLGRGVLGEGEDGLHGAGHGGREGRRQVLVQRGVADAYGAGGAVSAREGAAPRCWRGVNTHPASTSTAPHIAFAGGTDHRNVPPSRWRGCGCAAASVCVLGGHGWQGPPRAAPLAARNPLQSSGGGSAPQDNPQTGASGQTPPGPCCPCGKRGDTGHSAGTGHREEKPWWAGIPLPPPITALTGEEALALAAPGAPRRAGPAPPLPPGR